MFNKTKFISLAFLGLLAIFACKKNPVDSDNQDPVITKILPKDLTNIAAGQTATIIVNAFDPDGDPITFKYTPTNGSIGARNATGDTATFIADANSGPAYVEIFVYDDKGGVAEEQVNFEVLTAPPPEISVSPSSHDFSNVSTDSSASQEFVVTNTGEADLDISGAVLLGGNVSEFSIVGGGPFTLAPDSTQSIRVSFNPTTLGAKNTFLNIRRDDGKEKNVRLTGTGVPGPEPKLAVNRGALDYPDVHVNLNHSLSFFVRNDGRAELEVTHTNLIGVNANQFTIVSGDAPFTLAGGDSEEVVVSFNPISIGAKTAALSIHSTDTDKNVNLTGNGINPEINVTDKLKFNEVHINTNSVKTLQIENLGSTQLTGKVTVDGPDFEVEGDDSINVEPGGTQEISVKFRPSEVLERSAVLNISSNDLDESSFPVALTGHGINPEIDVNPNVHNYGDLQEGESDTTTLNVQNIGDTELVCEVSLGGTNPADFAIVAPVSFIIPAGDTHPLKVLFIPTDTGSRIAALTINSNDFDEDGQTVTLSGDGINPEIDMDTSDFSYPNAVANSEVKSKFFPISNIDGDTELVCEVSLGGTNPADFAIVAPASFTVPAGATHNLLVRFIPTVAGSQAAILIIENNDFDEDSVTVNLNGIGLAPDISVTPPSHNYGDVTVPSTGGLGGFSDQDFVVRNEGDSELVVTNAALTRAGLPGFEFSVRNGGGAFKLAPGQMHTITVRFAPTSISAIDPFTGLRIPKVGTLKIDSNDPDSTENPFLVTLSGFGI